MWPLGVVVVFLCSSLNDVGTSLKFILCESYVRLFLLRISFGHRCFADDTLISETLPVEWAAVFLPAVT